MNNKQLLSLIFFCAVIMAQAQTTRTFQMTFSPDDFEIVTDDTGKTGIESTKYGLAFDSDTLKPALPMVACYILIGQDESFNSFNFSTSDVLAGTFQMAPNVMPVPMSEAVASHVPNVLFAGGMYPDTLVAYSGTHVMNGYRFLSFMISPFKYDASNQQLYLNTSVSLSITLNVPSNPQATPPEDLRGNNLGVEDLVLNAGDITTLYPASDTAVHVDYEYLIVTSEALKPYFQPLADWKTTKGVRAKILTTEEIDSTYPGDRQQLRIKQALKDYWKGTYRGLKYVLLGGDVNIVPTQICYVKYSDSINVTSADYYYACLDGNLDWDTNNNGLYGEIEDSVDVDYDIIVTRLPIVTQTEIESKVNQIIYYEKQVDTTKWNNNILMAGRIENKYYYYDGIKRSDAHYYGLSIYNVDVATYWNSTPTFLYDTSQKLQIDNDTTYNFTSQHLQIKLSEGYSIAFIDTHGNPTGFRVEGTPSFYTTMNVNQLINDGNTIIYTTACHTNTYNQLYKSLGEIFMRRPNSGVIAYIGSSHYNWTRYASGNQHIMFRKLLKSFNHQVSESLYGLKSSLLLGKNNYRNPDRWLLFSLNMLGDPEMPFYKTKPQSFNNIHITFTDSTYTILTNEDSCKICVSSSNNNGNSFYIVKENTDSITLPLPHVDCDICVTHPRYIPFMTSYEDIAYIQNETITANKTINRTKVHIGRNVTDNKPFGPVTVTNGNKLSVKSKKEVVIKNSFTVENGATFELDIE